MKGIFPRKRRGLPVHSGPVAHLSTYASAGRSTTTVIIAENILQFMDPGTTVLSSKTNCQSAKHWNDGASAHISSLSTFLSTNPNALKSHLSLPASVLVDIILYKSICKVIANFSTKSTSVFRHILVAIGAHLLDMIFHFCPDATSSQEDLEEKSVSLLSFEKGRQNAKSPSRNCRIQNVYVLSGLRSRQNLYKGTDEVRAVPYEEEKSKELQMYRHEDF